jgi:D-3-phosphoglycerate dehydrogenase
MFKILVAEPTHPIFIQMMETAGFLCDLKTDLSFEELQKIIPNYQGLVIRSKFKIDKHFIDLSVNLLFIARAGSGMENIDINYAESKNIRCINSPEGNRDSLGEHTIGMLLNLFHRINIANTEVKTGIWNRKANIGIELQGKTVGILGYGNMGSAFARRLSGFDVNVIAYDKYKHNYSDQFVKEVSMSTLFDQADVFSIHVPLTKETEYMVNDSLISKFGKEIYLINTARGKILKTFDLVSNLKSGKVKGAALDVLEYENISFESIFKENNPELEFLFNAPNVIITPHVAGSSDASFRKIAEVMAIKIIDQFKA